MNAKESIVRFFRSITPFEYCLWAGAVIAIVLSFFLCGNTDYLNLAGSLLGATGLIFIAKGSVIGQIICLVFSLYYGFVSFTIQYYGEMITYLGMSAPIAIAAVISWLKHPFRGDRQEVEARYLKLCEYLIIFALGAAVAIAFYFILRALHTNNLVWSTVSVFTSFVATVLAQRRSPYYALGYVCNDIVLIVLWSLAAAGNSEYISLVVCFCVFLVEDVYGFVSWMRMRRRQSQKEKG